MEGTIMCVFCSIAKGEIPSSKVYEDENYLAFLDLSQATLGHTLVIPKKHYDNLSSCDPEVAAGLIKTVQKVEKQITKALNIKEFNVLTNEGPTAGQSVNHLHFHILPRQDGDDIEFKFVDHKPEISDLVILADKIKNA